MNTTRRQILTGVPLAFGGTATLFASSAAGQNLSENDPSALSTQVRRIISTRPRFDVDPELVLLPTPEFGVTEAPQLGTVTILFGKSSNNDWATAHSDLKQGNYDAALSTLDALVSGQIDIRKPVDLTVPGLEAVPTFADIYFQGRPIVESIPILDDQSISGLTLPYNGAKIRPEDFAIRLYSRQECLVMDPTPEWCAPIITNGTAQKPVVVIQPPPVSPLEAELLKSLEGQPEFPSVGDANSVYGYTAVAVTVAYVVVIALIATAGRDVEDIRASDIPYEGLPPDLRARLLSWRDIAPDNEMGKIIAPHLTPEAIKDQSPFLSARDLLDVRSELLRYAIGAGRN